MIGPLSDALNDVQAQKKHNSYISPRRKERLERQARKLSRDLLFIWLKQRKYDRHSRKYQSLENDAIKLIEKISAKLQQLSMYSPGWMVQYREQFETTL